jgi:hypothetical protein
LTLAGAWHNVTGGLILGITTMRYRTLTLCLVVTAAFTGTAASSSPIPALSAHGESLAAQTPAQIPARPSPIGRWDLTIPGITGGALDSDEGAPGPIFLQGDHGAVQYRNIVITPAVTGEK